MFKNMFTLFPVLLFFCTSSAYSSERAYEIQSPDGRIEMQVRLTDRIYYRVLVDDQEILWFSPLSMKTSQGVFGAKPELVGSDLRSVDETIHTVWGIRSEVRDHYNEIQLDFEGGYSVLFRAYNDGVAYRFKSNDPGELIVYEEEIEYRFWQSYPMVNQVLDGFDSSYEAFYTKQSISEVAPDNLIGLPSIVDQGDIKLAITESDVFEYPGFYLSKNGVHNRNYLNGKLPRYPTKVEQGGTHMFNKVVTERADYICKTEGDRLFPWRVIKIARSDLELADSDLVYKLARPSKVEDTDWIQPGLVAWDWWNAMNLTGVDFETGVNTETYKYFIDFASENGIPYVIMDEGWSDQFDVLLPTPAVDMPFLTQYAKSKGVKLILWMVADTIDRQYEVAFPLLQEWGIAGIKVDFIQRDDQLAIEYYERIAREAAKYELMVDYHGCSKPTGLHRTYPNLVNYEAVRGNEYNKFSPDANTPEHDVQIAFIRMLAGPMDYTPGGMRNVTEGNFIDSFETPMVLGTRARQMGMLVTYYSPIQMLCDAPTAYEQFPDILELISTIPATWDDTKVLAGKMGEFIVIARKSGDDWFVGGLNNWNEREVTIDLSQFAKAGDYSATILSDGVNANRDPEDFAIDQQNVDGSEKLKITMKQGGGFVLKLVRQ